MRSVYTTTPTAAGSARDEMLEHWAGNSPAIKGLWLNSWERFIPFPNYDAEIRRVIRSTNAIRAPDRRVPPFHPGAWALPHEQA